MSPEAVRGAAPPSEARRTGATAGRAAKHAAALYGRALHAALTPIRSAEAEVHHLHALEHDGEAAETPFIAMLGLIFFFLPIFLTMVGLAFAAYYLA
jgi:hypothetical protein